MDKRKIIPLMLIGALALAALGAVGFGALTVKTVYAQATTPTPTTPGQTTPDSQAFPGKGLRNHGLDEVRGGYTDEDLAAALGIETTELQAAYETAQAEALKEAVSQGLITQAQADQIAAQGAGRRMFGGRWLKGSSIDDDALLADALGISVADLQSARSEAFVAAVDRALAAGTITQEQADLMKGQQALANDEKFQASMKTAYEAAIAQAVQDGVITQAQADQILANSAGSVFPGWGGGRHGFGGPHGFGGRGQHGFPGGDAPAEPAAPTTPSTDGA